MPKMLAGVGTVEVQRTWVVPVRHKVVSVDVPLVPPISRILEFDVELLLDSRRLGVNPYIRHNLIDILVVTVVLKRPHVCRGEGVGVSIAYDAGDVHCHFVLGAGLLGNRSHPVVARLLVGLDNDVVALADAHVDRGRLVRDDWHHVGGNDLQLVAVDGEAHVVVHGAVDEPEPIRFALFKAGRESLTAVTVDVGAVDQAILGGGRSGLGYNVEELVGSVVMPVVEHDCTFVFVVRGGSRPVDENAAKHAIAVLLAGVGSIVQSQRTKPEDQSGCDTM